MLKPLTTKNRILDTISFAVVYIGSFFILVAADSSHEKNMASRYGWESSTPQSLSVMSLLSAAFYFAIPAIILLFVRKPAIRILGWAGAYLLVAVVVFAAPDQFFNSLQDSGPGITILGHVIHALTVGTITLSLAASAIFRVAKWSISRWRLTKC